jgi:hypothetical protein
MTIFIPKECNTWLQDHKPTEGDLLFAATLTIFAKMYGTKTFIEMESDDVKSLIWDKEVLLGISHLVRLEAQGLIQVARGLEGVLTFRFHPDLKIKHTASANNDGTIKIELKDPKTISLCYYLLGRLAFIRETGTQKDIVIYQNKYDASEGKHALNMAAVKKKHPDMPTGKRKYVRKKPVENKAKTRLNVIPTIYMDQIITKKRFTI